MVSCIGFSPSHRRLENSWHDCHLPSFCPQILWLQLAFLVGIKPLRAYAVTAAEKGVLSQFRLWKTAALSDQGRFHRGQTWTGAGPAGSTEEWAGCDGTISTMHESWMNLPRLHFPIDRGSNLSFDCSCQAVPRPGQDRGPVSWLTLISANNYLQASTAAGRLKEQGLDLRNIGWSSHANYGTLLGTCTWNRCGAYLRTNLGFQEKKYALS